MMRRWIAAFLVLFAVGCASRRLPSYLFSAPLPRPEEWTQMYPAARDRGPLKFLLVNDATGAVIAFFSHPTLYRSAASVAGELKVRFAQDGFAPSGIVASDDGTDARFRVTDPKDGRKGMVVVFRRPGVRDCIVAVGRWPAENDGRARADMDSVMARLAVYPEE